VDQRLPEQSQQATLRSLSDDALRQLVQRAIDVLTLRGAHIQQITAFLTPAAFRTFDLPAIPPHREPTRSGDGSLWAAPTAGPRPHPPLPPASQQPVKLTNSGRNIGR
jgi:hypothetical protein